MKLKQVKEKKTKFGGYILSVKIHIHTDRTAFIQNEIHTEQIPYRRIKCIIMEQIITSHIQKISVHLS